MSREIAKQIADVVPHLGAPGPQVTALHLAALLWIAEGPSSLAELRDGLQLCQSSTSSLVNELRAMDLVTTRRGFDHRVSLLELSAKAQRRLATSRAAERRKVHSRLVSP